MARKADWEALRVEFIDRKLKGETITIVGFCTEHGVKAERTIRRHTNGWEDDVESARSRITKRDTESMELNQLRLRAGLRRMAADMRRVHKDMLKLYAQKIAHSVRQKMKDREWCPTAADLATMAKAIDQLTTTGGGLPKVHEVRVDDTNEAVTANREQQVALRLKAEEFALYCEEHGIATKDDPDKTVH